jgi:hypothetical protein
MDERSLSLPRAPEPLSFSLPTGWRTEGVRQRHLLAFSRAGITYPILGTGGQRCR